MNAQSHLSLCRVCFGFPRRRDFLGPVSCQVRAGECWGILGPNGSGKSTLLRLMAGLLRVGSGEIMVRGARLDDLPDRLRAQSIAYMAQIPPKCLDATVREVVLMGRFPHRSWGLFESPEDCRIVQLAMERTSVDAFADRPLGTLSGGEAQRVHLAAALAQQTPILLLDEPMASLDIRYQLELLELLRGEADFNGRAVIVVSHDINLIARSCSHVLLMHEGRMVACGAPGDVITPEHLGPVYSVTYLALELPEPPGGCWFVPKRTSEIQKASQLMRLGGASDSRS